MKVIAEETTVVEIKTLKVKLDENELLKSIQEKINLGPGYIIKSATYRIPGGGDWSNMSVALDEMILDVVVEKRAIL